MLTLHRFEDRITCINSVGLNKSLLMQVFSNIQQNHLIFTYEIRIIVFGQSGKHPLT
jgi:hypothetical protein